MNEEKIVKVKNFLELMYIYQDKMTEMDQDFVDAKCCWQDKLTEADYDKLCQVFLRYL